MEYFKLNINKTVIIIILIFFINGKYACYFNKLYIINSYLFWFKFKFGNLWKADHPQILYDLHNNNDV